MTVSGMVKSSFVDYPGQIVCVLFVPGCNFDCFYCHNRQLIDGAEEIISPKYIADFLEKRAGKLDAVVISGGEPTLQRDLIPYMKSIKDLGYKLKLDTNGGSPEVVRQVLQEGICDYFAVDYKAPSLRYKEICGEAAEADDVLKTIRLLASSGTDFEVRTTVIPQFGLSDLVLMAKELPVLPRYVLNPYRKPELFLPHDEGRVSETPYTKSEVKAFAEALREYQPNIVI